jgi:hypothetical protein
MRRLFIVTVLSVVVGGSGFLSAHDEFRIIGTVASYKGNVLAVRKKEGTTVSINVDKQTLITRDKKKVTPAELTAGLTVVVDAYGDFEDDSLALEIRIVPPIAAR